MPFKGVPRAKRAPVSGCRHRVPLGVMGGCFWHCFGLVPVPVTGLWTPVLGRPMTHRQALCTRPAIRGDSERRAMLDVMPDLKSLPPSSVPSWAADSRETRANLTIDPSPVTPNPAEVMGPRSTGG